MLKQLQKVFVLLVLTWVFSTCIDPYTPVLEGYESLLVIEGVVTDEAVPYEVILTRSVQHEDSVPERVTDATVYISDESGNKAYLALSGSGTFVTNPAEFTGVTGETYTLHIKTADGREYASDPAVMLPVPGIKDIYYEKDNEYSSDHSELLEGLKIYVDTEQGSGENQYLRWEYEETWKFKLADYKRFDYINDSVILPIDEVKEYCWKTVKSSTIVEGSIVPGKNDFIQRAPVCFIAPAKSDRLTLQYSILVKQYSLSKEAYEFWNNLQQVNEAGGSIFDEQPYPVISNITCLNDPREKVLGYFQVSAAKQVRKNITASELDELSLPWFNYDCIRYVVDPLDYWMPGPQNPVPTWDEIYYMFVETGEFAFVEPVYNADTNELESLVFTASQCSDCELTGSSVKPDWWIDLESGEVLWNSIE
jgi:hypothetical protein